MKVKKILLMENIQNIWEKNKKKQMDWILKWIYLSKQINFSQLRLYENNKILAWNNNLVRLVHKILVKLIILRIMSFYYYLIIWFLSEFLRLGIGNSGKSKFSSWNNL